MLKRPVIDYTLVVLLDQYTFYQEFTFPCQFTHWYFCTGFWLTSIKWFGILLLLRICRSWFQFTLSKAFSRSRKAMWVSRMNSLLFSIVCLTVYTLSIHDLPILIPFCSSSNISSDIGLKRCAIIVAYITEILSPIENTRRAAWHETAEEANTAILDKLCD